MQRKFRGWLYDNTSAIKRRRGDGLRPDGDCPRHKAAEKKATTRAFRKPGSIVGAAGRGAAMTAAMGTGTRSIRTGAANSGGAIPARSSRRWWAASRRCSTVHVAMLMRPIKRER